MDYYSAYLVPSQRFQLLIIRRASIEAGAVNFMPKIHFPCCLSFGSSRRTVFSLIAFTAHEKKQQKEKKSIEKTELIQSIVANCCRTICNDIGAIEDVIHKGLKRHHHYILPLFFIASKQMVIDIHIYI